MGRAGRIIGVVRTGAEEGKGNSALGKRNAKHPYRSVSLLSGFSL